MLRIRTDSTVRPSKRAIADALLSKLVPEWIDSLQSSPPHTQGRQAVAPQGAAPVGARAAEGSCELFGGLCLDGMVEFFWWWLGCL